MTGLTKKKKSLLSAVNETIKIRETVNSCYVNSAPSKVVPK